MSKDHKSATTSMFLTVLFILFIFEGLPGKPQRNGKTPMPT